MRGLSSLERAKRARSGSGDGRWELRPFGIREPLASGAELPNFTTFCGSIRVGLGPCETLMGPGATGVCGAALVSYDGIAISRCRYALLPAASEP
jgi:hypothetical protein